MKNNHYRKFLGLFQHIHDAALIISKELQAGEYTISVEEKINQIILNTNEFIYVPFTDIQKEIESNFYEFSEGKRESYIARVLRDWIPIAPYFDISKTRETYKLNGILNVKSNIARYTATKNVIERNMGIIEPRLYYTETSISEDYVLLCHSAYLHFFYLLNELCIDFNLDLILIQEKIGFFVWDRFDPNFKMWKNSIVPLAEESKKNPSDLKKTETATNDYSALLTELSNYISNINVAEFNSIINHHALSPGTPKANWIGSIVDAHRFASSLNMKLPKFNACFTLSNGRKLKHHNKDITHSAIIDIIQKHIKD